MISEDDEIILLAFCRLRYARSARVHRPAKREHKYDNLTSRRFDDGELVALELPQPFNTNLDPDDLEDQRVLDELFAEFDLVLDLLPGETADMLRLDRFSSWYDDRTRSESNYEKDLKRIIKSWRNHRMKDHMIDSLHERYLAMIIFDPAVDRAVHLGTTNDDDWDQELWHIEKYAWREGIPPFDSRLYRRQLSMSLRLVNVQSRLDDFYKKLRVDIGGQ